MNFIYKVLNHLAAGAMLMAMVTVMLYAAARDVLIGWVVNPYIVTEDTPYTLRIKLRLAMAAARAQAQGYSTRFAVGGASHQSPLSLMKTSVSVAPIAIAASATVNGTIIDTKGYQGVVHILTVGVTDTETDMKITRDSASDMSDDTDITGAAITQIAADGDGSIVAIDVWRPSERYVRAVIVCTATGSTGLHSVVAILYRGQGLFPITQTLDELIEVREG